MNSAEEDMKRGETRTRIPLEYLDLEFPNEYSSDSVLIRAEYSIMEYSARIRTPQSIESACHYVALRTGSKPTSVLPPATPSRKPTCFPAKGEPAPPFLFLAYKYFSLKANLKPHHPFMTSLDNPPNVNVPSAAPCDTIHYVMSTSYLL